mmetsp:Transcript_66942/g.205011  ORF Transcript_66942/g.205011 Transcript_66942/m.205011 type:complete len:307 (-) Transcript_66942:757-1677(-)
MAAVAVVRPESRRPTKYRRGLRGARCSWHKRATAEAAASAQSALSFGFMALCEATLTTTETTHKPSIAGANESAFNTAPRTPPAARPSVIMTVAHSFIGRFRELGTSLDVRASANARFKPARATSISSPALSTDTSAMTPCNLSDQDNGMHATQLKMLPPSSPARSLRMIRWPNLPMDMLITPEQNINPARSSALLAIDQPQCCCPTNTRYTSAIVSCAEVTKRCQKAAQDDSNGKRSPALALPRGPGWVACMGRSSKTITMSTRKMRYKRAMNQPGAVSESNTRLCTRTDLRNTSSTAANVGPTA